jgi:hypothetical protein
VLTSASHSSRGDLGLVRVYIVTLTLPDAIGDIRRIIEEYDVALVTVDPLVAFIGDDMNTHRITMFAACWLRSRNLPRSRVSPWSS